MVIRGIVFLLRGVFKLGVLIIIITNIILSLDSSGNLLSLNSFLFLQVQLRAGSYGVGVSNVWLRNEAELTWRARGGRLASSVVCWWRSKSWRSSGLGVRGRGLRVFELKLVAWVMGVTFIGDKGSVKLGLLIGHETCKVVTNALPHVSQGLGLKILGEYSERVFNELGTAEGV